MTRRQGSPRSRKAKAPSAPSVPLVSWRLVVLAFFLSGAAGLMHQVVWSRLLVGLIGATAHAQAVVLAVFMGGLAIGAAWFGRRVDRRGAPLTTYVRLELLIAGSCLLIPLLLMAAGWAYLLAAERLFEAGAVKLVLRLLLAVAVVLFPAVLMGATLPVLARYLIGRPDETQRQVARLYGLNSLGAVLGAGIGGFITLPLMGTYASLVVASALNVVAAVVLWPAARRERAAAVSAGAEGAPSRAPDPLPDPDAPRYRSDQYLITLVALALSGFAAMGYEVLFVRVIALSFGLSVHSFTVMLMSFIAGISLGSLIIARVKVRRPLWLLGASQLAVAVALIAVSPLVARLPYYVGLLRIELRGTEGGFELFQFAKAALCLAVLLVPTTCLGFCFPLVAQIQVRRSSRIGSHVGSTYAWNTVGNVFGAIGTSLVLLPLLGTLGSFHFNVALNLVAGIGLLLVAGEAGLVRRLAAGGIAAGATALYLAVGTGWVDSLVLARNQHRLNERPDAAGAPDPTSSFAAWRKAFVIDPEAGSHFMHEEDAHTSVLVYGDGRQIRLYVNGKPDASTGGDLPTQMFLAHLPLMLRPEAKSLLVIGHGSGITAGSALRHPIERADIVEISRGVFAADAMFTDFNYDVLADPRVTAYVEDGQSFLRAVPRTYDLIISEPSNPWITGVAGLFTVEYFEAVRSRLSADGAATIWFHEYEQSKSTVEMVVRTIASVFPYVEVFRAHNFADMIVVASEEPLEPDFAAMEDRFDTMAVRNDLARIGITNLGALILHHTMSNERMRRLVPPGPLNTAAHQRLEYAAARAFFDDVSSTFLRDADGIYQQRPPEADTLMARYAAYREAAGEPITREEMLEIAQNADYLGGPSRHAATVVRALADGSPPATRTPSRPARGAVADPATMGLFEADYWDRRLRKEGRAAEARPFSRRVSELVEASEFSAQSGGG